MKRESSAEFSISNTPGWHYCQLCVPIYLQFLSLFASTGVSKYEIRNKGVHEDCILKFNATLDWLIFNDRAETKLAMLASLGENCALAANQSVDFRATILFTISLNSAKV